MLFCSKQFHGFKYVQLTVFFAPAGVRYRATISNNVMTCDDFHLSTSDGIVITRRPIVRVQIQSVLVPLRLQNTLALG